MMPGIFNIGYMFSYGKSGLSLIQNEDEDLKIEGATMLFLKKEMEQSLREFWTFMQTYAIEQEEQEEENEAIDEERYANMKCIIEFFLLIPVSMNSSWRGGGGREF